jgi:hypothetical protein
MTESQLKTKLILSLKKDKNYPYLKEFCFIEFGLDLDKCLEDCPDIEYKKMDDYAQALYSAKDNKIYLEKDCFMTDFVHELFHFVHYKSSKLSWYFHKLFKWKHSYKNTYHKNIYAILNPDRDGQFDGIGEGYIAEQIYTANDRMRKVFGYEKNK